MAQPLPRTIDELPYIMLWRFDDALLPVLGLIAGILLERLLLCVGIGVVLSFFYRRYREGRPEHHLLHALYWTGLWVNRGHAMWNPFERELRS